MTFLPERRLTPRVTATGNAVVHARHSVARCAIVDLSLGGVRLRRIPAPTIDLVPDEWVHIDLHLDGSGASWYSLRGRIHRTDDSNGEIIVGFAALPAAFEDAVSDEILANLECVRSPRVIVIDDSPERRRRIVATLRGIGCATFEATTPLDAISLIERSQSHVMLAAIAEDQHNGREIRDFLREVHPEIHLAVIADRARPGTLREGDLRAQVRRWLLPGP